LQTLARQHGIRKDRETHLLDKLFAAFLRRADEGTLSRLLVEVSVVLASGQQRSERSSRGRSRLQGGYRCDHPQGEAGVCAKEKAKKEAKPMPSGGAKNRKAAWITWGAARLPKILHIPAQRRSLRANATHSMRLHEWGLRARAFPSSGRCVRFSINVM
jgi:hypothetical protein